MALDRGSSNTLESGGDLTNGEFLGSLEASERRKHFGIEVSGNMKLVAAEPTLHRDRHW